MVVEYSDACSVRPANSRRRLYSLNVIPCLIFKLNGFSADQTVGASRINRSSCSLKNGKQLTYGDIE